MFAVTAIGLIVVVFVQVGMMLLSVFHFGFVNLNNYKGLIQIAVIVVLVQELVETFAVLDLYVVHQKQF